MAKRITCDLYEAEIATLRHRFRAGDKSLEPGELFAARASLDSDALPPGRPAKWEPFDPTAESHGECFAWMTTVDGKGWKEKWVEFDGGECSLVEGPEIDPKRIAYLRNMIEEELFGEDAQ